MTLRELQIGDRFFQTSKPKVIYEVFGRPEFNLQHGSATRLCKNQNTGFIESKSCRSEVEIIKPTIKMETAVIAPRNIITIERKATYSVQTFQVTDNGLEDAGLAIIKFCKGDKSNPDVPRQIGFLTETLIAVAKKYLEDNNVGDLATRETSMAITKLDEALMWIQKRADDRKARAVQGTYQK